MNRHRLRRCAAVLLAIGIAAGAGSAQARELDWATGASLEFSDNIRRVPGSGESEQTATLWAGFWFREERPALRLGLATTLEYIEYLDDTYDDESLLELSAMLSASLIPRRLHWHFENYFRQIRVTELDPITPDNRQDTNVLWTGPDLLFHLGVPNEFQVGARVGHHYYGQSDADNFRAGLSSRFTRHLRPRLSGFAHVESLWVRYEDDPFPDYERYDGLIGIDYRMRYTDLRVEVGRTWIDRDDDGSHDDLLAAARLTRRMPGDAAAGITYTQRYTDAGATLLAYGADPMRAYRTEITLPTGVVYERTGEIYYRRLIRRIDTRISAFIGDEEVVIPSPEPRMYDEDRDLAGGRLDLGYRLNLQWDFGLFVSYRYADYQISDRRDEDWRVGVSADYRLSRHFTIGGELSRNERGSSDPEEEFDENVAYLSLRYGERPPDVPL